MNKSQLSIKVLAIVTTLLGLMLPLEMAQAIEVIFLVKDTNPGDSSHPVHLVEINNTLFFAADDGTHGKELWKSDGTEAGTRLVKEIFSGSNGSTPSDLIGIDGLLFFAAGEADHGTELWRSDGTATGTRLVRDINAQGIGDDSFPANLTSVNGLLYFSANDGLSGYELWKSDGTEAGTVKVKEINPTGGSFPTGLTGLNDTLFFSASDGGNGYELWKSDGLPEGTGQVKDINPTGSSSPAYLTHVDGTLFFQAYDGVNGYELWKSDGTETGTVMVKDIRPGGFSSGPANLVDVNGTLFFQANDGVNGRELWKSDGTEAGTRRVKDINPAGSSNPADLANLNGTLFFTAGDGSGDRELWKSDGTEAGTRRVKDINPAGSSNPADLIDHNGLLFFSANDGTHGEELWKSDGTEAGTMPAKDINPAGSSNPTHLTPVGDVLFFAADDGSNGTELWSFSAAAISLEATPNIETAKAGQTITYSYRIINTGHLSLNDITLSDTRLGMLLPDQTSLAPGEMGMAAKSYTVSQNDLPGPLTNTATVTGTPFDNLNVTAMATTSVLLEKNQTFLYLPVVLQAPVPAPSLKRGVGTVSPPACADLERLRAAWYFNWRATPDVTCGGDEAEKYVPRIYDDEGMAWLDVAVANGQASGWLMGFSEPNLPWQGYVTPAEGAVLWREIEEAAGAAGVKLVSPSPNQWDPNRDGLPYGHQWTWVMVDEYQARYGRKPHFDALAWNIYEDDPEQVKSYLTARRTEALARGYDLPFWILEYGGKCWKSGGYTGNEAIMTEITTWFEETPWIGRYAWFANRLHGSNHNADNYQSCSLIDPETGALTSLGRMYATY